MPSFRQLRLFVAVLMLAPCAIPQTPSLTANEVDFPALIRETQQSPKDAGYAGVVWWVPTQYWQLSAERSGMSAEKAEERYRPLKQYTMVMVALGQTGLGNINWFSEADVRENVRLRDSKGNSYLPLNKLSGDAQGLISILKPVFANMLGSMGQNCVILFFAGANKMAQPIADPLAHNDFSVVVTKLIGGKDTTFDWELPLTNLSPPKYCPVGKERVQANWKYCPWHGVRLDEGMATSSEQK